MKPLVRIIYHTVKWDGFWWLAVIVVVLIIGVFLSWVHWEDLREDQGSLSTTVRNLGFVIGGIIAILLALWRSLVAGRQAVTAQRQTETAQHGLLNERYQKGVEMLGSNVLSVRLGGIYALQRIAEEHPTTYHFQTMQLFCAFVRHPHGEVSNAHSHSQSPYRVDIKAVMDAIGTRSDVQLTLEQERKYKLDLHGANLRNQFLGDLNLSGALLGGAILSGVRLFQTNLSGADLFEADLSGARLPEAVLTGASLLGADLSNIENCYCTDFSNALLYNANLTDANLSGAIVYGTKFEGAILSGAKCYDESGMIISSYNITSEAKATFREALDAHEAGLYRCVCRVLFPEIQHFTDTARRIAAILTLVAEPLP